MVRTIYTAIFLTFLFVCCNRESKGYRHPSTGVQVPVGQESTVMDNHIHVTKLAEKWATLWRQKEDTMQQWRNYNHNNIGGLTNFKVGPPEYLDGITRGIWKANLIETLRGCIRDYLLPYQESRLQKSWRDLRTCMIQNMQHRESQQHLAIYTNEQISKGINKVYKLNNKIDTDIIHHEQQSRLNIPPPPANVVGCTQTGLDKRDETHIGTLRRGELYTPLNMQYHIQSEGGCTRDIAKCLGWAIYGCKHREKFIYRNIVKYMDTYRDIEKKTILQEHRVLKNGSTQSLKHFDQLRNFIHKQRGHLGSYEIAIVALLYQTQIRIFSKGDGNNRTSNVQCIQQTTHAYGRVVNILRDERGYWTLITAHGEEKGKQQDSNRHIEHSIRTITTGDTTENETHNTATPLHIQERQPVKPHTHIVERGINITPSQSETISTIRAESTNTVAHGNTQALNRKQPTKPNIKELQREERKEEASDTLGSDKSTTQTDMDTDATSITTTTSIAALFIDAQLERRETRLKGNTKRITRRAVWNRWRNLVWGKHKREQRHKQRVERQSKKTRESRKLVFDYTKEKLSEAEVSLLGKGETFCVVNYKVDEDRSKVDLYTYQRRLRLHECFRDPIEGGQTDQAQTLSQRQTRTRRTITSTLTPTANNTPSRDTQSRRRSSAISVQTPIRPRNSVSSNRVATPNTTQNTHKESNTTQYNYAKNRRLPSTYDPESINRNLNRYNTCIQEEIMLTLQNRNIPFRDNISSTERIALKTLTDKIRSKQIIVTKADKGSGLVAVDYETYIEKGTKYIEQEANAYQRVEQDEHTIIAKIVKTRNKLVDQLTEHQIIPPHTAAYIKKQVEEKITGIKFYYKIHKDTNIRTMPLRPLQSCIKAPTHHLSIVLTDILQPLLTTDNIPTFIFDSNQLLFRLNQLGSIPEDCTLISSDVAALYPSIPHQEGFVAMHTFLKDTTKLSELQITSILKALELVITENYTTWNTYIYKQTRGVAMGTPVAVAYANIFMHWIDKEIKARAPYIHEHIRYIDDNIFILPALRIEDLMQTANNILPSHIRFTYEKLDTHAHKGLPFLDTQLTIAHDYTIQSRLYTKTTDRHAYLLPTSYHPPHITHNIPAAVLGRIKKLCSTEEWYQEDARTAVGWLLDRGYKKKDIDVALRKTDRKDRWHMIEQIEINRSRKTEETKEGIFRVPLIMTYNQHNKSIKKVLQLRQPLLNNAFNRTKVKPRLSYRRQRNLNDTLIQKGLRGPIEPVEQSINTYTQCGETPGYRTRCPCKGTHRQDRCRCCMHSTTTVDKLQPKLHKPVNCNSKNVIYVIGCKRCDKKYVGETQHTAS